MFQPQYGLGAMSFMACICHNKNDKMFTLLAQEILIQYKYSVNWYLFNKKKKTKKLCSIKKSSPRRVKLPMVLEHDAQPSAYLNGINLFANIAPTTSAIKCTLVVAPPRALQTMRAMRFNYIRAGFSIGWITLLFV